MTTSGSALGISTPTALLPGIGLMMRTSGLFTAYAMFRVSWVIRSTLTPAPKVTSYRVTVGPRLNPVTAQSTPNSANTCWTAPMTSSFACVCCRWGWPVRSSLRDGKVYMPAPPLSSNWIGWLIGGCSGSVADRLGRAGACAPDGWAPVRSRKDPARLRRRESGRCPHRRHREPRRDWPFRATAALVASRVSAHAWWTS